MKAKRFIQMLEDISPGERKLVEDHLMGLVAEDAAAKRLQFDIALMSDHTEAARRLVDHWNEPNGLLSGLSSFDRMTMGLAPGEMTVIGGATSHGKTLLAVNIAARIASQSKNVLFVTLEMTHEELTSRFMRILGDKYDDVAANVGYQKTDELDWRSIDGLIDAAVADLGVELVIIDHLHYFTRELENVSEDLGRITKELKKNAIRHKLPIVLISHTRKGDKRGGRTGIEDLRGTSYIAQDADVVIMVQRDENHTDKLLIRLEKNRNRYGMSVGAEALLVLDRTNLTLSDS